MARSRTSVCLALPLAELHPVCVAAIIGLGWRSTSEGPRRITGQELAENALGVNLTRVVICLERSGDAATEAVVNGANFGSCPLSAAHVRGQVGRLLHSIETGAARAISARNEGRSGSNRNVMINGKRIENALVSAFEREYATKIVDGAYWYDAVCGAWGTAGGPICGFIQSGLDLGGPLAPNASGGTSGVMINGRELGSADLARLWQGVEICPGRYWLNDRGDFGREQGVRIDDLPPIRRELYPGTSSGSPVFPGMGDIPCFPAAGPARRKPFEAMTPSAPRQSIEPETVLQTVAA